MGTSGNKVEKYWNLYAKFLRNLVNMGSPLKVSEEKDLFPLGDLYVWSCNRDKSCLPSQKRNKFWSTSVDSPNNTKVKNHWRISRLNITT